MGCINDKTKLQRKSGKTFVNSSNVLQPVRVRRGICFHYEINRELLVNRHYILWGSAVLFWVLFLIIP